MWWSVVSRFILRHDLRDRVQPACGSGVGPWARQVSEKGLSGIIAATRYMLCRSVIIYNLLPYHPTRPTEYDTGAVTSNNRGCVGQSFQKQGYHATAIWSQSKFGSFHFVQCMQECCIIQSPVPSLAEVCVLFSIAPCHIEPPSTQLLSPSLREVLPLLLNPLFHLQQQLRLPLVQLAHLIKLI
jgi:hypothetical protein